MGHKTFVLQAANDNPWRDSNVLSESHDFPFVRSLAEELLMMPGRD